MMVTAVIPVDKRKSKVFLEEGFAFVLYRGEVERYRIEEGRELEDTVYEEILRDIPVSYTHLDVYKRQIHIVFNILCKETMWIF